MVYVMREVFHEELGQVERDLSTMADLAAAALRGASVALLDADMHRANEVIRGEGAMRQLQDDLEAQVLDHLSTPGEQQAAAELHLLVASLRMGADLEHMAALAVQLARIAERCHPEHAVPEELATLIARMAASAAELADGASHLIKGQDLETARSLENRDDRVERLHRELVEALCDHSAGYAPRTTVDVGLAGRCYERFAHHAIRIARRVELARSSDRG